MGDFVAVDRDAARPRVDHSDHRLKQGALAAAVRAEDAGDLAGARSHRHRVQDLHAAVSRVKAVDRDDAGPGVVARLFSHSADTPRYASITCGSCEISSKLPCATIFPASITMIRSQMSCASSMSCSITRNVVPASRRVRM